MSVAVIYLERHGNNPHFARQFLKSMRENCAGAEFYYLHICKGFKDAINLYEDFPGDQNVNYNIYHIEDEKYALASIRPVIEMLPHDKILFFNSFSKILAPNWLRTYLAAFDKNASIALVGATGSLENNPHIRGNAWMMDRRLWLETTADYKMNTRDEEALTESGPDNITQRLIKNGMKAIVVDRHGGQHEDFGAAANIFRRGRQQDLLIGCNRTYDYDVSDYQRRIYLHRLAWGTQEDYPNVPLTTQKERTDAYTRWNYDLNIP